jgi:hypothetical protein
MKKLCLFALFLLGCGDDSSSNVGNAGGAAGTTGAGGSIGGSSGTGGAAGSGQGGSGVGGFAGGSGALPGWVNALPLWEWHEIPNTALSSVQPDPVPLGYSGSQSKIEAWCGAGLKREGSVYILGAAGGHADYAGNEVDALPLGTEAPAWVELHAPSADSDILNDAQFYLDERPSATHTYYATQFIDARNRMLVFPSPGMNMGGLPAPPNGWEYAGDAGFTFSFDLGTGEWDAPEYVPNYTAGGDFTAALVVKHPVTEDVYYSRNYNAGWWRWTQASNDWTKLSDESRGPWYSGSAIDPTRNRMLIVGGYEPLPPEVRELDGKPISVTFGGLGASALTRNGYPGVIFDEANDRYLVFFNEGGAVHVVRVNPETWEVDEPPMTGSAPVERPNGIQNAAQYAPELKGFVLANSYEGNVYFVRTAP